MKASLHLHLPKLALGRPATIAKIAAKYKLKVGKATCLAPASDENMFHICNTIVLGQSETTILKGLYDGAKALVQAEIDMTPAKK